MFVAFLSTESRALAKESDPVGDASPKAEREAIVPPTLLESAVLAYPPGGQGSASVLLELVIGVDGHVQDVVVLEGAAPFADVASTGVREFRFSPAHRGEKAVASRIRYEVLFRPPSAVDAPPPASSLAPAALPQSPGASTRAPTEGMEEVRVLTMKAAHGGTSISRAEVREIPGAFGDPFRALDALPGVTPIVSGVPFFFVRGAPPGNTGYFLDGIRVPYLFHVGAGPSVIHPGLVDHVDFYPAGYPADFGHFAGGVVAAETTAPRPETHGEGNLRLFDVGLLAETGFHGGRGTLLLGGRYSYTAALLSLAAGDTHLDYRDFQARATYQLSPNDRLSLLTFGSFDLLSQTESAIETVLFGAEFYRADLRYDRNLGPDTTARVAFTLGFDSTRIPGEPRNSHSQSIGTRTEVHHRLGPSLALRSGLQFRFERYTADLEPYMDPDDPATNDFNNLFPPRNDSTLGAYTSLVLRHGPVEFSPGLRVDHFRSGSASAIGIDPRLSARIALGPKVHAVHTFGVAHQPPSFLIPLPGLAIGNLQGGLQRTLQASAGVEVDLPFEVKGTLTAFDNIFENMSDTLGVTDQRRIVRDFKEPRSQGHAVGLEVYLRRKLTRRVGGYVSYTLSRSTRSVDLERFISAFDRPHVANMAIAVDLGKGWRSGTRFSVYSGTPVLPATGPVVTVQERSLTPSRDPAFYRWDLRAEKRWTLGPSSWVSIVAELMNATFHKEVLLGRTIGPVTIPSIGVEGAF